MDRIRAAVLGWLATRAVDPCGALSGWRVLCSRCGVLESVIVHDGRRAPDGTVFASNDFGTHLDRISPDGTVERRWAKVASGNGLVVDAAGEYLYAAETFIRAAIRRVEIAQPGNVTVHARPPLAATVSFLDGLAIDADERLYVAANGAGQLWRVDPDGRICAIARGLGSPSAVAVGRAGTPFPDLYAVTFGGDVVAIASP